MKKIAEIRRFVYGIKKLNCILKIKIYIWIIQKQVLFVMCDIQTEKYTYVFAQQVNVIFDTLHQ